MGHIIDFLDVPPSSHSSSVGDSHSHVLFLGMSKSGKSTLKSLISSSTQMKSAFGLDYSVSRKAIMNTVHKTHFWEFGFSASSKSDYDLLHTLLSRTITPDNLLNLSVVITFTLPDLNASESNTAASPKPLFNLIRLLHLVKTRIRSVTKSLSDDQKKILSDRIHRGPSYWSPETDNCGIPIFLIGSFFLPFDSVVGSPRTALVRSYRYLAHTEGCSLFFCDFFPESHQELQTNVSVLAHTLKALISGRTVRPVKSILSDDSPVLVLSGSDSMSEIGTISDSSLAESARKELRNSLPWNDGLRNWIGGLMNIFSGYQNSFSKGEVAVPLEMLDDVPEQFKISQKGVDDRIRVFLSDLKDQIGFDSVVIG
ncbi:hypothetical protein GEMRC1_007009 [Eukaryota sp. GEM-RC1]